MQKCLRPQHCPDCPFKSITVGPKGNSQGKIVIVGESPGSTEVRSGMPFIGKSGEMLDMLLERSGLNKYKDQIYITNALKCLPPRSKNQYNERVKDGKINDAGRACQHGLIEEIQTHPRDIIISLGALSTKSLFNKWNMAITTVRGQLKEVSVLARLGIMPTFHPAYILRSPGVYPQALSDFQRVRELLDGELAIKPEVVYTVLTSRKDVDYIVDRIKMYVGKTPFRMVGDIESTGLKRFHDRIRMIGFIPEFMINDTGRNDVYIITGQDGGELIHRMLTTMPSNAEWIWHNGKFDTSMLRAKGIPRDFARVDHDTLLLSYVLDEIGGRHSLESCVIDHLRLPSFKDETKEWMSKNRKGFADIPFEMLAMRNAKDVVYTGLVWRKLYAKVKARPGLLKAYNTLLIPGANTLATMELNGIPIDQKIIAENEIILGKELDGMITNLRQLSGIPDLNPNSSKQVLRYCRENLKLRLPSTKEEDIKKFPSKFTSALLEYRGVQKLFSTYITNYKQYGDRVNTTYMLHATVTGRLSSCDPGVQNTTKDEIVRKQYKAKKGRVLVEIDYSQAELRSLAVLSKDPIMIKIFRDGEDLHTSQATYVYGKTYTDEPATILVGGRNVENPIKDKMRGGIKRVNFGIIYGVQAPKVAQQIKSTVPEAQALLDGFAQRFVKAWEFIQWCRKAPKNGHQLTTIYGRERRYRIITSANNHSVENEASNFLHQSMCSDFTLEAAITVDNLQHENMGLPGNALQINIIHDALLFEIDDDMQAIKELVNIVKPIMESIPVKHGITDVPFLADAKFGYSWDKMEKIR